MLKICCYAPSLETCFMKYGTMTDVVETKKVRNEELLHL